MSVKCKYGDEESVEVVPCSYDQQSGAVSCPQPRKREARKSCDKALNRIEMDVHFVNEAGIEKRKTLIAQYDDSDDSDDPLIGRITQSNNGVQLKKRPNSRLHLCRRYIKKQLALTLADLTGELLGTFFMTLIICSTVTSAVITGAQSGLWQVAIVCGVGVSISIYCTSHFSDAHLNPAVTVAFSIVRWKSFSWKRVIPYILAQLLGGICAGGVSYGLYANAIEQFEFEHDIIRGSNNSVVTAMLFGEYFPNPALYNHSIEENLAVISTLEAMVVEAWTTGILAFLIFCFTDKDNTAVGSGSNKVAVPVLIGITVAILISLYGSLTQVGMNPARDFGPRILAAILGWGEIAIPGPRNGFWVYIVGPLIGAVVGGALYDMFVSNVLKLARAAKHKSVVINHESGSKTDN